MKSIEEYKQERIAKAKRITDLKQSIVELEKKLSEADKRYEEAIIAEDKQVDTIFTEIESLKNDMTAKKYRLSTLENITTDYLRKSAVSVLHGFSLVKDKYSSQVETLEQKIQEEKNRHLEIMSRLNKEGSLINGEFADEAAEYWDLIQENGIQGKLKGSGHLVGFSQENKNELEKQRLKATEEGKLIPLSIYSEIERAAEGSRPPFVRK